jgi:hypothetical protein
MTKIGLMGVCSNCHGHENNQVYMISKPRQEKNKLSSKFRSWNKKNKNKNTIRAKQKFNKILLQGKYKNMTRLWQENVSKTSVEHTKSNGIYLFIPIGHLAFEEVY